MRKGWKIVLTIVLIALFLGAAGVGVGLMTGADGMRIYDILDERYNITMYYEYSQQVMDAVAESWNAPN